MRKLTGILLALGILASCSTPREEILKVYNWADYIDEDLITEFEQWYEEQTGEKVTIIYQTFDVNETMLSKIELGHEDYDLVCPSDYIIERMLMNDLLLPIDRDFGDTPDYIGNLAPYIVDCFDNIEGFGKNANDYAVGYMWGTTGLIYNPKFVSAEDVKSWDVLNAAIAVDDGARYFGEVALVPYDSPIRSSGLLFYNTLYDENASCHLAFGEAYPECIVAGCADNILKTAC